MSRRKPTHARLRGLHESDDARVSRSSRGTKYIVSGKPVGHQKFEVALATDDAVYMYKNLWSQSVHGRT
jgi:hypothetical protein